MIAESTVVDGRYRVVGRLGSGGMADVYCAEDLQLGRKVALKLLHPRFAEDEEFVERFKREAQSAAGLQHPHVVGVFDRGEWDGTYYIAMEYLEGEPLKDLVRRSAPLDPEAAIDLAVQVLRAARFAHKRGIIHRDLKPHNVIVDGEGRAKVTDFGIARAGASDMTQTGSIMGTAQYLSPEQAQGHDVDETSDLYAVGVVLYEMLTGRVPFEGESAVTIALKHVSEAPVPPSALNPAVTPALDAVVLRALAKDRADRFPDADAFMAALEQARAGVAPPVPQRTDTTAFAPAVVHEEEVVAAEPDRRRRLWALLGLLALAALAAVLVLALGGAETRPVPDVVRADQAAAAQRLRDEGFEPVIQRVRNPAPEDRVIGQDPPAGTQLEVGSQVALTVSSGPGTAAVPDLRGQPRSRARRALRQAGFRIDERREPSDEIGENRVIETSPDGGSQAQVGSTVTLVISSGAERVTVPGVVGQSLDSARDELDEAGLDAAVQREASEDREPGTVLRQDPAPGARAARGSTVNLVVAQEPEEVEIPDVTGEGAAAAAARLAAAGLEVRTQDRPVDRPRDDDRVLEQRPGSGRRVPRGTTVTLVVGRFRPDLDPDPQPPPEPGGEAPPEATPPPGR